MVTGHDPQYLQVALEDLGAVLSNRALSASTTATYSRHWYQWEGFCQYMRWSPWLTGEERGGIGKLGQFAVYAWRFGFNQRQQGNSYGTIRGKLSSIRWMHRRHLGLDIGFQPEFVILLQGPCRKTTSTHHPTSANNPCRYRLYSSSTTASLGEFTHRILLSPLAIRVPQNW